MRLLHQIFVLVLALAGNVAVSDAQVVPGRHPIPPGHPPGMHIPDGGHEVGGSGGAAAFLFFLLLISSVVILPFVFGRALSWWSDRRSKRERDIRKREEEKKERERQERIRVYELRWHTIEERVQGLLAEQYPMHGRADIERIKRELRYSSYDITRALNPLLPVLAESITIFVHCLGEPRKGETIQLFYDGKQIGRLEIQDVELTLWHIRRRSGGLVGPITVAPLRELVRALAPSPGVRVPRGMQVAMIRNNRDSEWVAWGNAGSAYPELVLAGVVQGEK